MMGLDTRSVLIGAVIGYLVLPFAVAKVRNLVAK